VDYLPYFLGIYSQIVVSNEIPKVLHFLPIDSRFAVSLFDIYRFL